MNKKHFKKPLLIIPVETRVRELDAKLLMTLVLLVVTTQTEKS